MMAAGGAAGAKPKGGGLAALMAGATDDGAATKHNAKSNWKLGAAAGMGNKSLAHLVKAAQEQEEREKRNRAKEVLDKIKDAAKEKTKAAAAAAFKPGVHLAKGASANVLATMIEAKERKQRYSNMAENGQIGDLCKMFWGSCGDYWGGKLKDFWNGMRSEHALVSFLYPHEEETTILSDPQVAQIFWNMLMVENMVCAMLYDNDDDGPLISIKVIILIFIATGIMTGCGIFCRLVFKWGNKGKRFKRTKREAKAATKDLKKSLLMAEMGGDLDDAARMRLAFQKAKEARKKKKTLRQWLDICRLATAWMINIMFYLLFLWFIITYAMLFGPEETKGWLLSWALGAGNAWGVVEPFEVLVLVMMPFLFDNQCVADCRTTAKELGII